MILFFLCLVDWRRYNELRLQLDNYVFKTEQQLDEAQRIGTTVTELEEQLQKHKVYSRRQLNGSEV